MGEVGSGTRGFFKRLDFGKRVGEALTLGVEGCEVIRASHTVTLRSHAAVRNASHIVRVCDGAFFVEDLLQIRQ